MIQTIRKENFVRNKRKLTKPSFHLPQVVKRKGESICTYIQNTTDSKSTSIYKIAVTFNNEEDNNKDHHEFEIQHISTIPQSIRGTKSPGMIYIIIRSNKNSNSKNEKRDDL